MNLPQALSAPVTRYDRVLPAAESRQALEPRSLVNVYCSHGVIESGLSCLPRGVSPGIDRLLIAHPNAYRLPHSNACSALPDTDRNAHRTPPHSNRDAYPDCRTPARRGSLAAANR